MIEQAKRQGPKEPTLRQWWLARNKDRMSSIQLYQFAPRGGGYGWYSSCAKDGMSVDGKRLTEAEKHSWSDSYWLAQPNWTDERRMSARLPINSPYAVWRG